MLQQNRRKSTLSRQRLNSGEAMSQHHESFSAKLETQSSHRVVPLLIPAPSPLRISVSHEASAEALVAPVALKLDLEDDDEVLDRSASVALSEGSDSSFAGSRLSVAAAAARRPNPRVSALGAVLKAAPSSGV